jgi:hypothetical protein
MLSETIFYLRACLAAAASKIWTLVSVQNIGMVVVSFHSEVSD